MKKILTLIASLALVQCLSAQTNLQVNPNTKYQKIEGWGGSLCWWANVSGGWSEAKINEICTWITSPNELNMNVFRYNIGGGDAPSHDHMRKDGGAVPGFKASESASYDWSRDANQRKILLKLKALRSDAIFEAFSNSPPYWMTKSGCASGSVDGDDNLKDDYYDDFANYLTDVVKFYKDNHGITFRTVAPFNEPFSGWWKANGGQEGCRFTQGVQGKMIKELYTKLSSKGMLNYCTISAMDAHNIDDAYRGINRYLPDAEIMPKIAQINTHSYRGELRTELYTLVKQQGKRLWQSESGPLGGIGGSGMPNYLAMSQRLITDLRDLKPVAWLDWQLMAENDPRWGLIPADYATQTYRKDKSYYLRMQCTRFLKQDYTVINSSDSRTVAALNPANNELVLVVLNQTTAATSFNIDLSLFGSTGSSATVYRTTPSENCAKLANISISNKRVSYSAPSQSLTTFIIPVNGGMVTGISDGTYNIVARHSGQFLDVTSGSTANGANVAQYPSTGGANQRWIVRSIGDGYYTIVALHSGKSLDVSGRSLEDGANIAQWTSNSTATHQQFQIVSQAGGFYQIIARHSNKCLDVAESSVANGANVQQWNCSGGTNQSFQFVLVNSASRTLEEGNQKENIIVAYPNPFTGSFRIKAKGSFTFTIKDHLGNDKENGKGKEECLIGSKLKPGMYILKVQTSSETKEIKIIKN